ncbi:PDZ domain-containing protein [Akkermansia muciniphila]|uniref:PDZ domain-containing protein n=1 Tax=Akkermansia muciniphila TaxID=239935 RepID=UPI001CA4FA28
MQKDGPCSSAGILPGDVLLMAGGNKVDGVEKLERLLPSSGKLTVTVRRNQENRKVDLQF